MKSYVKIIVSGHIIDFTEYQKLNVNSDPIKAREDRIDNEDAGLYKAQNYVRTMRNRKLKVRQLINTNFTSQSRFITLTFADNITDVKVANHEFEKFIKRLRRRYGTSFKYISVVEFQKRGAVHYHVLTDLEFIKSKDLQDIWGQGFVKINRISHVDNVGAYVVKYMTEDLDDTRLQGLKAYNGSRNLSKPTEFKSWVNDDATKSMFELLESHKKSLVFHSQHETQEAGTIIYRQYNLSKNDTK